MKRIWRILRANYCTIFHRILSKDWEKLERDKEGNLFVRVQYTCCKCKNVWEIHRMPVRDLWTEETRFKKEIYGPGKIQ